MKVLMACICTVSNTKMKKDFVSSNKIKSAHRCGIAIALDWLDKETLERLVPQKVRKLM